MMKLTTVLCVLLSCVTIRADCLGAGAEVASFLVCFRVVDENGAPVPEATIRGGGWIPDGRQSSEFSATTKDDGHALVRAKTAMDIGGEVAKPGFYRSVFYTMFGDKEPSAIERGRWQPWGATNTVVLKHIRNPVPMYGKYVKLRLPPLGCARGYDLEKGDWVLPYGKGVVSDLVFCVTGQVERTTGRYGPNTQSDLRMTVTFANAGDGIQTTNAPVHKGGYLGSLLASSHEAPAAGYLSGYSYHRRERPSPADCINVYTNQETQIAYIRVRSRVDEQGAVISAMYGKMYGDLWARFRPDDGSVEISFAYYLNPDGTRNVEFDPNRNLLHGLRSLERTQRP